MTYSFTPKKYVCPVHGSDLTALVKAEVLAPPQWALPDGVLAEPAPPPEIEPGPFAVEVHCKGVYADPKKAPKDAVAAPHDQLFQGSFR